MSDIVRASPGDTNSLKGADPLAIVEQVERIQELSTAADASPGGLVTGTVDPPESSARGRIACEAQVHIDEASADEELLSLSAEVASMAMQLGETMRI